MSDITLKELSNYQGLDKQQLIRELIIKDRLHKVMGDKHEFLEQKISLLEMKIDRIWNFLDNKINGTESTRVTIAKNVLIRERDSL